MTMRVKVIVPSGVLLEEEVVKVVAEAQNGSFCLLPGHVDFVAALVPSCLALTARDGVESFLAVVVNRPQRIQRRQLQQLPGPLGGPAKDHLITLLFDELVTTRQQ